MKHISIFAFLILLFCGIDMMAFDDINRQPSARQITMLNPEQSQGAYAALGPVAEVDHGLVMHGEHQGWRLFTRDVLMSFAKRVAPDGTQSYKCLEIRKLSIEQIKTGPNSEYREIEADKAIAAYDALANKAREINNGPIAAVGKYQGHILFTTSLYTQCKKFVAPDGRMTYEGTEITNPHLQDQ